MKNYAIKDTFYYKKGILIKMNKQEIISLIDWSKYSKNIKSEDLLDEFKNKVGHNPTLEEELIIFRHAIDICKN